MLGAQLAGTDMLAELLGALPGIVDPAYMQGGHGTTTATLAARMAEAFPELKLVALLRDPIERARAQHQLARARGRETRRFDDAIRGLLSADGLSEGRFLPDDANTYVVGGEYGRILGEYLRYFPRSALHVELTSALQADPEATVGRVLRFLGLSTERAAGGRGLAPRGGAPEPVADDVRDLLAAHYAADAEVLRAVTGLEAPWAGPDPEAPRARLAVYTAIAGGEGALEDPEVVAADRDYICFTDDPYLRSDVWQIRPLERFGDEPARRAKALAHRYLPEYESSVWVNADVGPVRRRASFIRQEIEDVRTVVLSPPKAGRSWVNYFLARYVAERTGDPVDLNAVDDGREFPPVKFVHEHIDVFEHSPAPVRLLNEDLLMGRRIVVLVRDPRDAVVSYWHHKRLREGRPVGDRLELFVDCPVYGIERLSQGALLLLELYDRHPGDKLLLTYEDLVADPARRLPDVLRFVLEGRTLDEEACQGAVEASRFERMREWERGLTPEDARARHDSRFGPRQGGVLEDDHFKVRRGKVGAFRLETSPELRRHVAGLRHTSLLLERLAGLRAPAGPVIWLTGLPAAGKSTIATLVAEQLRARGVHVRVLDGDALRRTTSRDLGFSRTDRDEHVARTARLAAEAAKQGGVVIVALVSPFRAGREAARAVIGAGFKEVHVQATVAACIRRDPRGRYRRALAGELAQFTGISDPYEAPESPALVLDTEHESPQRCAGRVLALVGQPWPARQAIIQPVASPLPDAAA